VAGSQAVAQNVYHFLRELGYRYESYVFHSLSVGGYQSGEVLLKLVESADQSVFDKTCRSLKGIVYDSTVFPSDAPVGMAKASTANPVLQTLIGKMYWDEKCKPCADDANKFPPKIIGAVKTRPGMWYYFDRDGKYCARKDKDVTECTDWKDNKEAFGCDADPSDEMQELCDKPTIKAAGNHWPLIYVFRGQRYWQFDNKEQPGKPLGKLLSGPLPARDKWPGIHLPGGQSFHKTAMVMVYRNKWSLWHLGKDPKGDVFDEPILDKGDDDDEDGDVKNAGALINVDVAGARYAKIKGDEVCNLQITYNQSVWIGDCRKVVIDAEQFPPSIVAAIKGRDHHWYYFNENGKHCKRKEGAREQCTDWKGNGILFGCNAKKLKSDLESLCDNVTITSGGNYPPFVYVFRGRKYWKFNGHYPKPGKPFGELLKGNRPSKEEFDGIHMPGGVSFNKNAFVVVYKNTWSQWKPKGSDARLHKKMRKNDNEINNAPIGTATMEIIGEPDDQPDGDAVDRGALVALNEKKGRYAVIRGQDICYYAVTDSKCSTVGKCVDLSEDRNNFPPNVVAVLRDRDKNWYFFNTNGKYCKRNKADKKKCSDWKSNEEAFGCRVKSKVSFVQSLCGNVQISSGTNFSPFLYVFRGAKYWKFNNRPKAGKPFGDIVEGGKLAADKWPDIHFPGGVGYRKTSFVMIYKNKWSLWKKSVASVLDEPIGVSTEGSTGADDENDVMVKASADGTLEEDMADGDADYEMDREEPFIVDNTLDG
ncbi:unnamed protein product, partial [Oppiella nova]